VHPQPFALNQLPVQPPARMSHRRSLGRRLGHYLAGRLHLRAKDDSSANACVHPQPFVLNSLPVQMRIASATIGLKSASNANSCRHPQLSVPNSLLVGLRVCVFILLPGI